MTKKKKELTPQLRFKEFEDKWKELTLRHLIKSLESGVSVNSEDRQITDELEYGILKTSAVTNGLFEKNENKKIVDKEVSRARLNPTKNEIIISRMNTPELVGESGYIGKTYPNLFIPDRLWQTVISVEKCHNRWLSYFLVTSTVRYNLKSIATGTSGSMKNISKPNFLNIKVNCPSLPEQKKIASFLSVVDQKIQQLTKKKELLEQYKKGIMQQLFSQKIRFKPDLSQAEGNEDGEGYPEWEEKRLGDIAIKVSKKNKDNSLNYVLTNSSTQGIVSQSDYFDKNIANLNNLEGYYVVDINDFVYNPRISSHAPVGPIKRNKLQIGVMSPLYTVFRFREINLIYLECYFSTVVWHKYLNSVANFGARHDRMNISQQDFFKMPIPLPCCEEQQKIASFLSDIDIKIEQVDQQISQTEKFKKGLLQQMFV